MKKLNYLIVRSFIFPFILAFSLLLLILVMQTFWLYIDDLLGKGLEWYIILEMLFYASANVVPLALPLAVLLASTMSFGNLAESLELTAIKSSGLSFLRISRPIFVCVLGIAAFAFYFSNTLWPQANFKFRVLVTDITNKKTDMLIKEGTFTTEMASFSLRAGKKYDNGELGDLLIYDRSANETDGSSIGRRYSPDPRDYHREIRAKKGRLAKNEGVAQMQIILEDGRITEELDTKNFKDMELPYWTIDFKRSSYSMDVDMGNLERSEDSWGQSLEWMSLQQLLFTKDSLRKQVGEQSANLSHFIINQHPIFRDTNAKDEAYNVEEIHPFFLEQKAQTYQRRMINNAKKRIENHKRHLVGKGIINVAHQDQIRKIHHNVNRKFTLSVACIILFFVGASLGAIVKKGGLGMPVLITVVLFLIYYILLRVGEQMISTKILSPFVGNWLSSFVLLPVAIILTYKANKDSSILEMGWVKKIFSKKKHEDSSIMS